MRPLGGRNPNIEELLRKMVANNAANALSLKELTQFVL